MKIYPYAQLFVLIIGFFVGNAQAQTEEDGRYWLNLSLAGKLPAESWLWTFDFRPRWREEGSEFDQYIASGYLIKQLNKHASLGLGIDHIVTHPSGGKSFEENRLTPQFLYKFDEFFGIKLVSRTRLESRHREDFDDTAYRLREQLRAMWAFPKLSRLSLVLSNELMLNLNDADWNIRRGIDQNRAFVGLNWKTSQQTSVDIGYQNQYINTRPVDRQHHILMGTLYVNF